MWQLRNSNQNRARADPQEDGNPSSAPASGVVSLSQVTTLWTIYLTNAMCS